MNSYNHFIYEFIYMNSYMNSCNLWIHMIFHIWIHMFHEFIYEFGCTKIPDARAGSCGGRLSQVTSRMPFFSIFFILEFRYWRSPSLTCRVLFPNIWISYFTVLEHLARSQARGADSDAATMRIDYSGSIASEQFCLKGLDNVLPCIVENTEKILLPTVDCIG